MARSFLAFLSCLAFLGMLVGGTHGVAYMSTLNNTGIAFPQGVGGNFRDVYADQQNDFFILLTDSAIYRMNYQRTRIESSFTGFSCCYDNNGGKIHAEILGPTDYIFLAIRNNNNRRSAEDGLEARAPSGTTESLWRFDVKNLTVGPTVYNFTSLTNGYQLAIDSSRNIAFAVSQVTPWIEVVDLLNLTMVTRFNYTQGTFPWFNPNVPGGWAIVFDSDRNYLYIGVDCNTPTPGIIWQWDVTTVTSPLLIQSTIFASNPCFNSGFIEKGDGRAWLYEDDAGWIGGFDQSDLSWGSDYSMATINLVGSIEYDESIHTAYIIDSGRSSGGSVYPGSVFRSCPLDYGNVVHEVLQWHQTSISSFNHAYGTFIESSTGTLYIVSSGDLGNAVTTISLSAGTDCPQSPSQASAAGQLVSPLMSLREALF